MLCSRELQIIKVLLNCDRRWITRFKTSLEQNICTAVPPLGAIVVFKFSHIREVVSCRSSPPAIYIGKLKILLRASASDCLARRSESAGSHRSA